MSSSVQYDKYLPELLAEKDALDPAFVHCMRLLTQEIERVQSGKGSSTNNVEHLTEKVYVPVKDFPGFNFVGRLLGPRGLTLKRMQAETGCRMTVMGRGSIRNAAKEDELRAMDDSRYDHLKEDLHVLIEAKGPEKVAEAKLAAGVAEVRKMIIPGDPNDHIRSEQLRELALLNGVRTATQGLAETYGTPGPRPPMGPAMGGPMPAGQPPMPVRSLGVRNSVPPGGMGMAGPMGPGSKQGPPPPRPIASQYAQASSFDSAYIDTSAEMDRYYPQDDGLSSGVLSDAWPARPSGRGMAKRFHPYSTQSTPF